MAYQFIIRLIILLIVTIVLFVSYIRFVESRAVFLPHIGNSMNTPKDLGLDYEDVFFKTQDGLLLNAWFIPASSNAKQRPTFLFFHGNAGSINDRIGKIQFLHQLNVNVFVIDYRGYGRSEGSPSEKGIYLDAQAGFDYLVNQKNIDAGSIIVYGVSLGGAPAVDLALNRPVAGLVLESTFTCAGDMARKILPIAPLFLVKTKLDSISKIKDIRVPKMIIHSTEDEMIPFDMGRRLYEAAVDPKDFLEIRGGHNEGYFISEGIMMTGMRDFLNEYF